MLSSMRALLILTVLCAVPLISAEDLVPDPALQSERLPNGMRLAVQAQAQPPGRVVLRLLVTAGSLAEREDERGLAHFLEHAAFLGSSTFPDGSLVPHMQALGLAFGAHTNAHTSYDETVYKLELPAVDAGTIDTGLAVMADWAGGLTFPAAAIERERGVVLAEMRDRDTPGLRRWLALSQLLYAGTTLPRRHPIGDEGVLRASGAAQLRALYEGVYRPERMALVVVGDIDAAAVLAAARTRFTALTGHGPERPQVAPGMLEAGVAAAVHHDAEADGTEVLIALVRPWTRPADSIAQRRLELEQELAERVLTRRLQRLVDSDPATPFLKPEVFSSPWAGFFSAGVTAQARPGAVLATARVLEVERRRLLAFGPLPGELATAADEMRTALAQAVAQAGTRTSAKMADSIYESIRDRRVWMSPLQQQQLALPLLAQATTAAVTSAAQVIWAEGRMAIFAGGREDLGAGGATQLEAAWRQGQQDELRPPVARAAAHWAYGELPAGAVPSATAVLPHGIISWRFPNGAVLVHQGSTRQPGQVVVSLRLYLSAEGTAPGTTTLLSRGWIAGGLGKHDRSELSDLLSDGSVRWQGPSFDEQGALFAGTCLPADLPRLTEVLRANLVDPGWRRPTVEQQRAAWLEELAGEQTDLDVLAANTFQRLVVGNASYRRPVAPDEARAVDAAAALEWFRVQLAHAPLVLSVVGDVSPSAALAAAARTIGTLGERRSVVVAATSPPALRPGAAWPATGAALTTTGAVARTVVMVGWPTGNTYDIRRHRRTQLLTACLGERLRESLRQRLGQAYSPAVYRWGSDVFNGEGHIACQVSIAPEAAATARAVILAEAARLATEGPDEDLFTRVRTPLVKSLPSIRNRNDWWLGSVVPWAASQPFRMDWITAMDADYTDATRADIAALAAALLVNARAIVVEVSSR